METHYGKTSLGLQIYSSVFQARESSISPSDCIVELQVFLLCFPLLRLLPLIKNKIINFKRRIYSSSPILNMM